MALLEIIVEGTPISHQTRNRAALKAWQKIVRDQAATHWNGPPRHEKMKLTVIYFHRGSKAGLDHDNMVKPIQDALNRLVYEDDRQITHAEIAQLSLDETVEVPNVTRAIVEGLARGEDFLWIQVELAPTEKERKD